MTDTPADAAASYAARGWRVVPIRPGAKAPMVDDWPNAATTSPIQIGQWWGRWPGAGVGIATGTGSGIVVLDVDTQPDKGKHGDETLADLEATYGPLPDTLEVLTGSGGRHLYFSAPDGVTITNRGNWPGMWLDVRGEGGQVLAPPTVHPNGTPYAWVIGQGPDDGTLADLPPWLLELLTTGPATEPRAEYAPYTGDSRPGDRFNATHTWPELLTADGATYLGQRTDHAGGGGYELWARPGVDHVSASLYYAGTDLLKVFTSNWPGLEASRTYDRFGFWACRRFGGDHGALAAAIAEAEAPHLADWVTETVATPPPPQEPPVTPLPEPTAQRPTVYVNGRTLDAITGDIIRHLAEANDPPGLFVRAGMPTRVRSDETGRPLVEPLDAEHLRWHATARMGFARRNVDKGPTACVPAVDIFRAMTKAPSWPFPALVGITEAPVIAPSGAIRTDHGYDAETCLYHWRTADYPPIPDKPTTDQLTAAVALVTEMLCDFPFDTSADRANAWALLLTGLVRPLVAGQVPLAVLDAPEPGTGKSLLAELVAIVATGRTAAIQPLPDEDEELEKRITGMLLGGATIALFDNAESTIRSPILAAALTADTWQGRILGRTGQIQIPNRATWMVTGNNIDVGGDLARRCYRIRIDAHQARPWERSGFLHPDLKGWLLERRGDVLAALVTIIRSWWCAGRPAATSVAAMGGYTPWVRTVGGILAHAGITDFLGNLAAFHAAADTDAQEAEAFLTAWHNTFGDAPRTVAEVVSIMEAPDSEPRGALPGDLIGWWGTPSFTKRLGRWLLKRAGRHYGSEGVHAVRHEADRRRVALWSVDTRVSGLSRGDETRNPRTNPRTNGAGQNGSGEVCEVSRVFSEPMREGKREETYIRRAGNTEKTSQTRGNPRPPSYDPEELF